MNDFTPQQIHLDQARQLWMLDETTLFHRYVANYIYFVSKDNRELVLRLTPSTHRTKVEVQSEVEFINFLSKKGLETVVPVKSLNGHFVETIQHSELTFHVCVFVKIKGTRSTNEEAITPHFLKRWGAYLGKLHNFSEDFTKSGLKSNRAFWKNDSVQKLAEKNIPSAPSEIQRTYKEVIDWLNSLETSSSHFGLIHGDFHLGNYFVVDNKIISFDYDDSSKHWFMSDIAASMSSVLKLADSNNERSRIIRDFFDGYQSERQISVEWLNHFEKFYQYRLLIVYNWMNTMIAEGRFSEETVLDWKSFEPWYIKNINEKRFQKRISNET